MSRIDVVQLTFVGAVHHGQLTSHRGNRLGHGVLMEMVKAKNDERRCEMTESGQFFALLWPSTGALCSSLLWRRALWVVVALAICVQSSEICGIERVESGKTYVERRCLDRAGDVEGLIARGLAGTDCSRPGDNREDLERL